ncbi:YceI family protein [Labrys monachus]|uniref:Polyisoprenoid-binding protein YceI n=1 Tax=Labrys monachus TaxID=217067 RepID=A0ABU0FLL1_9HYPH|nr:YceI family protein [Labrys monachus]MDQ0395500.1 polyisoprenoid-binding protein YceI [Labrys monachus]
MMKPKPMGPRPLLSAALAALFLAHAAVPAVAAQRKWRIDPGQTSIGFVVDGVGWPQTKGRFRDFEGRIAIDFDHPESSHVSFHVAAKSVDVGSPSFDDYLRTDAFFDAARFPTIAFESTKVEKVDDRHARVTGNLTLRGVTRPLTIDVEVEGAAGASARLGFRATGTIHRLAFNMSAGFPAISNDVALVVTTQALAE